MQALIQCVSKVIGWKLILPKVVTSGCRLIVYWFLWGDVIIGFTGFMFHFVSIIEFMTCFYEFTECESMNFSVEKATNFLLVKKAIFSLSFERLRIVESYSYSENSWKHVLNLTNKGHFSHIGDGSDMLGRC